MAAKWTLIAVIAFLSLPVHGHLGDRLVPIFEIPDEEIANIDIHDGSIDDWLSVIGEPTLMALEFGPFLTSVYESYDPDDLDFRVWLAWHRTSSRVYVAVQGVDDVYLEERDRSGALYDGRIEFTIDGDHSGGIFMYESEQAHTLFEETQKFIAAPYGLFPDQPVWVFVPTVYAESCCWFGEPPFADAGGGVIGESPSVWVTEMYVTPFDLFDPGSEDETVISAMLPSRVVGFQVGITDADEKLNTEGLFFFPPVDDVAPQGPDYFADALLVGADGSMEEESAVHANSWGRIKASLSD